MTRSADLEASLRCEAKGGGSYICRSFVAARRKAERVIAEAVAAEVDQAQSSTPHHRRFEAMTEEEYQAGLAQLRQDWGRLLVDPAHRGILQAAKDPTTGLMAGMRAPLIAEIVNRALEAGR